MPIDPNLDFLPAPPADWEERRSAIFERDKHCCQVTGCLNREGLEVHHVVPMHERPDHRLENLVLLCPFHHALLPHDKGALSFRTDRYTVFRSYWRWNFNKTQRFKVNAKVRREPAGRVTEGALKELFQELDERYVIECRHCRERDWKVKVDAATDRVTVACRSCWRAWLLERSLREEIGVQLFESAFAAGFNEGRFRLGAGDLQVRAPVEARVCESCRASGRLAVLEREQNPQGGTMLRCENWNPKGGGCPGTAKWREGDEERTW